MYWLQCKKKKHNVEFKKRNKQKKKQREKQTNKQTLYHREQTGGFHRGGGGEG